MQVLELTDSTRASGDECCPPSGAGLLPRETAEAHAALFRALADPARVRLLAHIAAAECSTVCACHLPELVGLSQPTLSHHLKKLTEAGLIDREMRGRWAHYTVHPGSLAAVRTFLAALPG